VTTKNNPPNASRPQHYCNAAGEQVLCRLEEIADGGSKEIVLRGTSDFSLCLVRQEENVYAYRNPCPHTGSPLNWVADKFLSLDGEMIQCALHGALFRITDGLCIWGPCLHKKLTPVAIANRDGDIVLVAGNLQPEFRRI
jgi:nitrite reductase/ring-hydroxylating ferredoxin subunit